MCHFGFPVGTYPERGRERELAIIEEGLTEAEAEASGLYMGSSIDRLAYLHSTGCL